MVVVDVVCAYTGKLENSVNEEQVNKNKDSTGEGSTVKWDSNLITDLI